ncbi:MAG: glycosyltransferase family 2 protein [Flavobacteriaceae bacterium]|nr:glycosyltransferase family 2 protein [Flavobacteriaceae bacterium]
MVSVIIPLYNKAQYITQSMESVLKQSFTDFELIVVNDGSDDNSLDLISSYSDKRIKIYTTEHKGVSHARNFGLEKSCFNWVSFLDADDWWHPDFLSEILKQRAHYPNDTVFVTGRTHVFSTKNWRYSAIGIPQDGDCKKINYFKTISTSLPPINCSNAVVLKEEILSHGGFKVRQKKHEDHDLWSRICVERELVFLNKNLSFYRNTDKNSASNKFYHPDDFCSFLDTLISIKGTLSKDGSTYFQKYCNRFVLVNYIKYYAKYSKEEDKKVLVRAGKLLHGKHLLLLQVLAKLPYKKTYVFFKIFKPHGS